MPAAFEPPLDAPSSALERTLVARALADSDGSRAEAARRLGINRWWLYPKLEEYGIN